MGISIKQIMELRELKKELANTGNYRFCVTITEMCKSEIKSIPFVGGQDLY